MKNVLMLALVFAAACGDNKSALDKKDSAPKNLAMEIVSGIEEDAKCTSLYQGDGPLQTHAVTCKLTNKVVVFCSLDTQNGFRCTPLNAGPQQGQQQQGPQPPQAQLEPPAPAPAQAPAPAVPQPPVLKK